MDDKSTDTPLTGVVYPPTNSKKDQVSTTSHVAGIEPGVTVFYADGKIVGDYIVAANADNELRLVFEADEEVGVSNRIAVFMYITLSDLDSEDVELYNEDKQKSDLRQLVRYKYSESSEPYTVEIFTTED